MSFTMSHSVVLQHPIDNVFPVFSRADQMERLQKLTPEAQEFTLLPSDFVSISREALSSLKNNTLPPQTIPRDCPRPRDLPALSEDDPTPNATSSSETTRTFQRSWFEFSGTVPILFGLIHRPLSVAGAQIVDEEAKVVLFESGVAAQGIKEVKVRTFEEVRLEDGREGTEVRETVWGTCPFMLSLLLKVLAPRVHREHMELYHKLFESG